MEPIPPLLLEPLLQQKVWGGTTFSLKNALQPIGEMWAASGRAGSASYVASGEMAGMSLDRIYSQNPENLCGNRIPHSEFPLLCKFIDANDNLSVQVHPNDEIARANGYGPFGKTECWYIADATPGAHIIAGFKPGVTAQILKEHCSNGSLEVILDRFPIASGDMLFIPAGCVHAILTGTLIYEVQQSSDTTMRLFDWNRNDSARPLHISQSIAMASYTHRINRPIPPCIKYADGPLVKKIRCACRFFCVEEIEIAGMGEIFMPPVHSCILVSALSGRAMISTTAGSGIIEKYDTICLSAQSQSVNISSEVSCRLLVSYIPDLKADVIIPLLENDYSKDEIAALAGPAINNDLEILLRTMSL